MNENTPMPVLLLTGYLGSGKTTLLNRILNNRRGIRFAVIVNDIGEVNIDADLIAKGGVVDTTGDSLVPLQNGCICCTLKTDLARQIADLAGAGKFDYIVIEASGICEPEPIAQTICALPQMGEEFNTGREVRLDCITTVVDALRLRDEFASGDDLTRDNIDEEDIESLVIQQMEFCNIILLNKISEVTPDEAKHIRAVVRAIQPKAKIMECDFCDVPLDDLLNTGLFDFEQVATSATWVQELEKPTEDLDDDDDHDHHDHDHDHEHDHHHEHEHEHEHEHHHDHDDDDDDDDDDDYGHDHGHHHHHHHHDEGEAEEYGIGTFVYYARKPFSLNRFDYFCAKHWPESVIRAKGVCYFAENPDMSYLFEQAGKQKRLMEAGRWYATAPKEDLEVLLARDPGMMKDWDEVYGDRMEKIVFIGRNMDKGAIIAALDGCLTDYKK